MFYDMQDVDLSLAWALPTGITSHTVQPEHDVTTGGNNMCDACNLSYGGSSHLSATFAVILRDPAWSALDDGIQLERTLSFPRGA